MVLKDLCLLVYVCDKDNWYANKSSVESYAIMLLNIRCLLYWIVLKAKFGHINNELLCNYVGEYNKPLMVPSVNKNYFCSNNMDVMINFLTILHMCVYPLY